MFTMKHTSSCKSTLVLLISWASIGVALEPTASFDGNFGHRIVEKLPPDKILTPVEGLNPLSTLPEDHYLTAALRESRDANGDEYIQLHGQKKREEHIKSSQAHANQIVSESSEPFIHEGHDDSNEMKDSHLLKAIPMKSASMNEQSISMGTKLKIPVPNDHEINSYTRSSTTQMRLNVPYVNLKNPEKESGNVEERFAKEGFENEKDDDIEEGKQFAMVVDQFRYPTTVQKSRARLINQAADWKDTESLVHNNESREVLIDKGSSDNEGHHTVSSSDIMERPCPKSDVNNCEQRSGYSRYLRKSPSQRKVPYQRRNRFLPNISRYQNQSGNTTRSKIVPEHDRQRKFISPAGSRSNGQRPSFHDETAVTKSSTFERTDLNSNDDSSRLNLPSMTPRPTLLDIESQADLDVSGSSPMPMTLKLVQLDTTNFLTTLGPLSSHRLEDWLGNITEAKLQFPEKGDDSKVEYGSFTLPTAAPAKTMAKSNSQAHRPVSQRIRINEPDQSTDHINDKLKVVRMNSGQRSTQQETNEGLSQEQQDNLREYLRQIKYKRKSTSITQPIQDEHIHKHIFEATKDIIEKAEIEERKKALFFSNMVPIAASPQHPQTTINPQFIPITAKENNTTKKPLIPYNAASTDGGNFGHKKTPSFNPNIVQDLTKSQPTSNSQFLIYEANVQSTSEENSGHEDIEQESGEKKGFTRDYMMDRGTNSQKYSLEDSEKYQFSSSHDQEIRVPTSFRNEQRIRTPNHMKSFGKKDETRLSPEESSDDSTFFNPFYKFLKENGVTDEMYDRYREGVYRKGNRAITTTGIPLHFKQESSWDDSNPTKYNPSHSLEKDGEIINSGSTIFGQTRYNKFRKDNSDSTSKGLEENQNHGRNRHRNTPQEVIMHRPHRDILKEGVQLNEEKNIMLSSELKQAFPSNTRANHFDSFHSTKEQEHFTDVHENIDNSEKEYSKVNNHKLHSISVSPFAKEHVDDFLKSSLEFPTELPIRTDGERKIRQSERVRQLKDFQNILPKPIHHPAKTIESFHSQNLLPDGFRDTPKLSSIIPVPPPYFPPTRPPKEMTPPHIILSNSHREQISLTTKSPLYNIPFPEYIEADYYEGSQSDLNEALFEPEIQENKNKFVENNDFEGLIAFELGKDINNSPSHDAHLKTASFKEVYKQTNDNSESKSSHVPINQENKSLETIYRQAPPSVASVLPPPRYASTDEDFRDTFKHVFAETVENSKSHPHMGSHGRDNFQRGNDEFDEHQTLHHVHSFTKGESQNIDHNTREIGTFSLNGEFHNRPHINHETKDYRNPHFLDENQKEALSQRPERPHTSNNNKSPHHFHENKTPPIFDENKLPHIKQGYRHPQYNRENRRPYLNRENRRPQLINGQRLPLHLHRGHPRRPILHNSPLVIPPPNYMVPPPKHIRHFKDANLDFINFVDSNDKEILLHSESTKSSESDHPNSNLRPNSEELRENLNLSPKPNTFPLDETSHKISTGLPKKPAIQILSPPLLHGIRLKTRPPFLPHSLGRYFPASSRPTRIPNQKSQQKHNNIPQLKPPQFLPPPPTPPHQKRPPRHHLSPLAHGPPISHASSVSHETPVPSNPTVSNNQVRNEKRIPKFNSLPHGPHKLQINPVIKTRPTISKPLHIQNSNRPSNSHIRNLPFDNNHEGTVDKESIKFPSLDEMEKDFRPMTDLSQPLPVETQIHEIPLSESHAKMIQNMQFGIDGKPLDVWIPIIKKVGGASTFNDGPKLHNGDDTFSLNHSFITGRQFDSILQEHDSSSNRENMDDDFYFDSDNDSEHDYDTHQDVSFFDDRNEFSDSLTPEEVKES